MNRTFTLFSIGGTPLRMRSAAIVNLLVLWGLMIWLADSRHPEWSWWVWVAAGALGVFLLMLADWGHAIAHIFSARLAQAPMDEVLITTGMPHTRYFNNDVSPAAHRMRALGGPLFSGAGLLLSWLWLSVTPETAVSYDFALLSTLGHGLIFTGCLAPLPIVDGGSVLKWTLVERGRTVPEADRIVKQLAMFTGVGTAIVGLLLLIGRWWILGVVLLAASGIAIRAAQGKIG